MVLETLTTGPLDHPAAGWCGGQRRRRRRRPPHPLSDWEGYLWLTRKICAVRMYRKHTSTTVQIEHNPVNYLSGGGSSGPGDTDHSTTRPPRREMVW